MLMQAKDEHEHLSLGLTAKHSRDVSSEVTAGVYWPHTTNGYKVSRFSMRLQVFSPAF